MEKNLCASVVYDMEGALLLEVLARLRHSGMFLAGIHFFEYLLNNSVQEVGLGVCISGL